VRLRSKDAPPVITAGGNGYSYDANGNMNRGAGNDVAWYSYDLPNVINGSGGVSSQFFYGPDRQRYKQVAVYTGGSETAHYIGGVLEKLTTPVRVRFRHQIFTPGGLVASYVRRDDNTEDTSYFTSDHLGSIDSISNSTGTTYLSYDAFGKRRAASSWSGGPPKSDLDGVAYASRRGYTEHETLDNLQLIHMNGRVQDPHLGRFIPADPFVFDPANGQALNRYSYVANNPLSFTDPSGFIPQEGGDCDCSYTPPPPDFSWATMGRGSTRRNTTYRGAPYTNSSVTTVGEVPDADTGSYDRQVATTAASSGGLPATETGEYDMCSGCEPRGKGPKFEDWMIMFPPAMIDPLLDYYVWERITNNYVRVPLQAAATFVGPRKVLGPIKAAREAAAARGAERLSDITVKVKQFSGKSFRDQKSVYEKLRNTYQEHLKKYGAKAGETSGETNRMERELEAMRDILSNRGRTFGPTGEILD
jgi:RHS repeat-associated protein